uniref:Putative spindle assembly checkpoint protein n=1 Tax=Culex tarsalis TaxID=7177 RepID=A0A1Q3EV59_CULTA
MSNSEQKNVITLSSSAALLVEYINYAINTILYQRDVSPKDEFVSVSYNGLPLFVSNNYTTLNRIQDVLDVIQPLIALPIPDLGIHLILMDKATGHAIERWEFVIHNEDLAEPNRKPSRKNTILIQHEIRQLMKQITASISCLPVPPRSGFGWKLSVSDLPTWVTLPAGWFRAPRDEIYNPQQLELRSFSTGLHQMETIVTYREDKSR